MFTNSPSCHRRLSHISFFLLQHIELNNSSLTKTILSLLIMNKLWPSISTIKKLTFIKIMKNKSAFSNLLGTSLTQPANQNINYF